MTRPLRIENPGAYYEKSVGSNLYNGQNISIL